MFKIVLVLVLRGVLVLMLSTLALIPLPQSTYNTALASCSRCFVSALFMLLTAVLCTARAAYMRVLAR